MFTKRWIKIDLGKMCSTFRNTDFSYRQFLRLRWRNYLSSQWMGLYYVLLISFHCHTHFLHPCIWRDEHWMVHVVMGCSEFHSDFFYSFSVRRVIKSISLVVALCYYRILVQGGTLVGILLLQMRKPKLIEVKRLEKHLFGT